MKGWNDRLTRIHKSLILHVLLAIDCCRACPYATSIAMDCSRASPYVTSIAMDCSRDSCKYPANLG